MNPDPLALASSAGLTFDTPWGKLVHDERRWQVCTNRHPSADGSAWGWIDGPGNGNHTWGGSRDRTFKAALAVCKEHNAWLDAQVPVSVKLARLVPQLTDKRAKVSTLEQQLSIERDALASLEREWGELIEKAKGAQA